MTNVKTSTNNLITESGKVVTRCTTEEFATIIMEHPGTIYGFSISLHDMHEDQTRTVSPWPYYNIVNLRLIDVQAVYIHNDCLGGTPPIAFEIPSYDWNEDSKDQDEKCLQEIIDGLTEFNLKYGNLFDTWYITEEVGTLEAIYHI